MFYVKHIGIQDYKQYVDCKLEKKDPPNVPRKEFVFLSERSNYYFSFSKILVFYWVKEWF